MERKYNEPLLVTGTMFFKEGKLLIDKPRKRDTFQMIGGKVEIDKAEHIYDAAIRECHEELGDTFFFEEEKIEYITSILETATSDPKQKIVMNLYKYNGKYSGEPKISEEIEAFKWFGAEEDKSILSNTLKDFVIPYCIENGLIY